MAKKKSFDCIQMKDRIRAETAREYEGLSDRERWERVRAKLATLDSPLAKWWRGLVERGPDARGK